MMAELVDSAEQEKDLIDEQGVDHNNQQGSNRSMALDQTLQLLKAKDDTSRFIGLSLLRNLLESQPQLQEDSQVITRCWNAISPKFLDRLLKAKANEKRDQQEADAMVALVIAVLHNFAVLLPQSSDGDDKLTGRVGGLVAALERSSPESSLQALQTLLLIVRTEEGSHVLFRIEDWSPLVHVGPQQEMALDVMIFTFLNILTQTKDQSIVHHKLNTTIMALLSRFQEIPDVSKLFACLRSIISMIPIISRNHSLPWVVPLGDLLRQTILKHRSVSRQAAIILAATLLRIHPGGFASVLFHASKNAGGTNDSKPEVYLFVKLLLVDIKSSIPSLQEVLNSADYSSTSERLAACYDLVSAFINHLLSSIDNQDPQSEIELLLAPDLLLELRKDILETVSLTIEYLRDRYDASIEGAPGLHDEATSAVPAIAWDSSTTSITRDPLPVSQIGTLALWLSADDNEALRREAAGIADVLLYFYTTGESPGYKAYVPIALEPIVTTSEGIEAFLSAEGWANIVKELPKLLVLSGEADSTKGMDIVRVLLSVVEAEETGPVKEEWMSVVEMAVHGFKLESGDLDLKIAVAQLAVEVLVKSPRAIRCRLTSVAEELLRFAKSITAKDANLDHNTRDGLDEIVTALSELVDIPFKPLSR